MRIPTTPKTDLISVIVPVYNVEKYLRQCLDSIVNQTYQNIEIVCVNDASPDNSLVILNEYAAKDSRIVIVNKKVNEGSSLARKTGLEHSKGKFIITIDSDDWVELDMLETMLKAAQTHYFDMVCCGIIMEREIDGKRLFFTTPNIQLDKIERMQIGLSGDYTATIVIWNKLVRREIYEKVIFPKESNGEDEFITCQFFYYCDKIGTVHKSFNHYRWREDSISNDKNKLKSERNYADRLANYQHIVDFLKEKFPNDLSIFELALSKKRIGIEHKNPNKSIVFQELEVLKKFLNESPEEAIKKAKNYIEERVNINIEKIKNTDEAYCLPSFMSVLDMLKKCVKKDRLLCIWQTTTGLKQVWLIACAQWLCYTRYV